MTGRSCCCLHDNNIIELLAHRGAMVQALWVASFLFHGISFSSKQSLLVSAPLPGLAGQLALSAENSRVRLVMRNISGANYWKLY